MEGLILLAEARAAGLKVEADGGDLVIRGPRSAEPIVRRLLEHKPAVLAAVRSPIEVRAQVFRQQVEAYWSELDDEWQKCSHQPIPPVALPGVVPVPGACPLCGDPLGDDRLYRCVACEEAMRIILAMPRDAQ